MASNSNSNHDSDSSSIYLTFRSLTSRADRKFALVRDLPPYSRGPHVSLYHRKVFKAYTELWHMQQSHRAELVSAGLSRPEIGELASRIGQLYYDQYLRTGEWKFLIGSFVFYQAILERGYFGKGIGKGIGDVRVRFKELRFLARFLIVAILVEKDGEIVRVLEERLKLLVEESKEAYKGTSFKEWKQVISELDRFLKSVKFFENSRSLRYNNISDSYPNSISNLAPLYSKRCLRLYDAVLTSYHKNEVKFSELTLDTFRMQQCLEYEPINETKESNISNENGILSSDNSGGGVSGLIDINLTSELDNPNMLKNPRKAVIYHPKVSHLISVIATICEEISTDNVLLIYISASALSERSVCLGPRRNADENILYPEDIIPFTRIPLFLIIDSQNSQSFKAGYK